MKRFNPVVVVLALGVAAWIVACSPAAPPSPAPAPSRPAAAQPAQPAAPAAAPKQPVTLKLLLAPFGTGGYNVGFGLSDIARKSHPWLRLSPSETPGYVYNIKALNNPSLWDNTLIGTDGASKFLAAKGDPLIGEQVTGVRILFTNATTNVHLVTLDPNIKTPADLKGKRIGLGLKAQSYWGLAPAITLEHGWGITEKDANIQYLGPGPAKTALMDGRIDAAVVGFYSNPFAGLFARSAQLVELSSSPRPFYHIPWGKTQTEEASKKTGFPILPVTFKAGALSTMKEDVELWAGTLAFGVKDVFPDELAYEMVKLVHREYSKLGEYDEQGKLITPELMAYGWTLNDLHPGAVQAYKELGVKLPEK